MFIFIKHTRVALRLLDLLWLGPFLLFYLSGHPKNQITCDLMCCLHNIQILVFSRGCPDKFDLHGRVADLKQQGRRVHECLRLRPRVCPQKVTRSAQGSPQSLLGKICLDEQVRKTHTHLLRHTHFALALLNFWGVKKLHSRL